MTITSGALTALWLQLSPPFSANMTLSGAVRFDRKQWENQELELQQCRMDLISIHDANTQLQQQQQQQQHPSCPVEIVALASSAICSRGPDMIKYRIRRRYTQILPGEDERLLSSGRFKFGGCMDFLRNQEKVRTNMEKLWTTALSMELTGIELLLGRKYTAAETTTHRSIVRDATLAPSWKVSPWGAAGQSEGVVGIKMNKSERENNADNSRADPLDGTQLRNSLTQPQFIASYVAIWRIMIGSFVHLNVHPARDRRRDYDATMPRRDYARRSGNWLGLHPDYRARAVEQAEIEWLMFVQKGDGDMSEKQFQQFLLSLCELNVHRRTEDECGRLLSIVDQCWKVLLRETHAVSFRQFPSRLVYEPRDTVSALEHITNDGLVVLDSQTSRVQQGGGASSNSSSVGGGVVGTSASTSTSTSTSTREKLGGREKHNSKEFHRGGGKQAAMLRAAASISNDKYFQPECNRFTFGRRTPMTPVPEDRSKTPGPGTYSPWSSYPFQEPFGTSQNLLGFPFEKSLGRVESPRTREREKREERRKKEQEEARRQVEKTRSGRGRTSSSSSSSRTTTTTTSSGGVRGSVDNGGGGRRRSIEMQQVDAAAMQQRLASMVTGTTLREKSRQKSGGQRLGRTPSANARARKEREEQEDARARRVRKASAPLTSSEYEKRLQNMQMLGATNAARWSVSPHARISSLLDGDVRGGAPTSRRMRNTKNSMPTMCHPQRYGGTGTSSSSRGEGRGRRGGRRRLSPPTTMRSSREGKEERKERKEERKYDDEKLWSDDDDDVEDEDEEDEILYDENMTEEEEEEEGKREEKEEHNNMYSNRLQFGRSPSAPRSNAIVDDAMNILYSERCREMNGEMDGEMGHQSDDVVLFVEGEGGKVSKDIWWKQQRSSAKAMMQAFSNREDMSMYNRQTDPHSNRTAKELRSCRLSEDDTSWAREVGKINSAPRVQGGLEQVLIKRAARRRAQQERLSQYYD